jgi:hypothetical protein
MKKIKTHLRVPAHQVTVPSKMTFPELVFLDNDAFDDEGGPAPQLAYHLYDVDQSITGDCYVVTELRSVPFDTPVQEAEGSSVYRVLAADWFRRKYDIEDDLIIVSCNGRLVQRVQDYKVVLKLSELFPHDWREIDYDFGEIRCPK